MIAHILRIMLTGSFLLSFLTFQVFGTPSGATPHAFQSSFSFLENKGQITDQYGQQRADIDFRISAGGVNVFVGEGAIRYQWARPADRAGLAAWLSGGSDLALARPDPLSVTWEMYRMDVELVGANRDALLIKENKLDYYERYYLPQCGPEGATASSYEKLTYKNVYPYIDWVLYVKDGHMKYDFVVHPGGKVSDIRLQYGGVSSLTSTASGELIARTPFGSVTEHAPISFQEDGKAVASRFVLADRTLSFAVDTYEGTLTIDPTLEWGTYYGDMAIYDIAGDIAYDTVRGGYIYLCGMTVNVTNIATTGAYQVSLAGEADAYLVKFDTDGLRQWGTYFGGTGTDGQTTRIVSDTLGNIYMAGTTRSPSNIATPGCFQDTLSGYSLDPLSMDHFLAKFDADGARIWASYYGGNKDESTVDLATDGLVVYMAGTTESASGIATAGSHQPMIGSIPTSESDAYLARFDSAGNREWATYYGGERTDEASSVGWTTQGFVYITGYTRSASGISTLGAHQEARGGMNDAFIAKFSPEGMRQWGTYYGGAMDDIASSIHCDELGNVFVAGMTKSTMNIATGSSQQSTLSGGQDIFIVKFDSMGVRQWGTYYGGAEDEWLPSIVLGEGKLFVAASTFSLSGIATPGAHQTANNATFPVWGTVFLGEFSPASGIRDWATYYGGERTEAPTGIANDARGYVYIGGGTGSTSGIATPGSHKDTLMGPGFLSFLAKFCVAPDLTALNREVTGPDSLCAGAVAHYSIDAIENATAYIWTLPSGWSGSSDSNSIAVSGVAAGGVLGVQVVRCEDTSAMQTLEVHLIPADPAVITIDGFVLGTVKTTYTSYQWLYNDSLIPGATGRTHTVTANGDYRVITTNSSGCADTSAVYTVKNYTGISDKELRSRIKVFPNPAQAEVRIQSPVPVNVRLSSMEGRSLLRKDNAQSIDLGELAPGVYILHIEDRNGRLLKAEQLVKGAE